MPTTYKMSYKITERKTFTNAIFQLNDFLN